MNNHSPGDLTPPEKAFQELRLPRLQFVLLRDPAYDVYYLLDRGSERVARISGPRTVSHGWNLTLRQAAKSLGWTEPDTTPGN